MQAADVARATCITLLAPHVLLRARVRMVCHGSAVAGALGAAVAATHVLDTACAHCAAFGGANENPCRGADQAILNLSLADTWLG